MKRLYPVLATAMALAAGSALAADLPAPAPLPPPPPSWTGFYAGLNAGGSWSNSSINTLSSPAFASADLFPEVSSGYSAFSAGAASRSLAVNNGGFIGGGEAGYNWQFSNSFVAGLEADIQGVGGNGRTANALAITAPIVTDSPLVSALSVSKRLDYLGTVRGRLGYLVMPTLLAFAGGGLAYGQVSSNASVEQTILASPFTGFYGSAGSFSSTRVGWSVGGGLEWMFLPNWSVKAEYLYYDLGNVTNTLSPLTITAVQGGEPFAAISTVSKTRYNGNIVRAGLNYHFNWGVAAPVVAKY